jgi:hypothetical protein
MNILSDIRQIIVIAVFVLYLKSTLDMHVKMFVNLPGTLLHEFSHFIVAVLFNGKPTSLSVLPEQMKDGSWAGGYVMFSNIRWYNAMPIGFAPLLVLLLAWNLHAVLYDIGWLSDFPFVQDVLYVILEAYLIEASLPSIVDVKIALSKPAGIVMYVILAIGLSMMVQYLVPLVVSYSKRPK